MKYGKKYLSEVLSIEELLSTENNKICIISGVGSGKNYFVTNVLSKYGTVMCVSSRRAKVDEMLHEKICEEKIDWDYGEKVFTTTNYGVELLVKNERFSTSGIDTIKEHFNFLVIDEIHSLATDSTYTNSSFHVHTFIEHIATTCPHIKIIGMTGTPEPIEGMLIKENYQRIDKRSNCINVLPAKIAVIDKEKAIEIMSSLPENEKTIYYTHSARGMLLGKKALRSILLETGVWVPNEIGISMADTKAKEIMSEADNPIMKLDEYVKSLKNHIVINHDLPRDVKVLLTTSTLKEGINIESEDIRIAFCESHLLSDIQQFAGRIRNGLEVLYIIDDGRQFDVRFSTIQENVLELLYEKAILGKTNRYIEEEIINAESAIYHPDHGGYEAKDIELIDIFGRGNFSIYNANTAIKIFVNKNENRFKFMRFNHLKNKMELYHFIYAEQKRCYTYFSKGWASQVENYCNENEIIFKPLVDTQTILRTLPNYVEKKLVTDNEKLELTSFLDDALTLKSGVKISTYNKKFKEHHIPYEIKQGYTTRNKMSVRYYEVVSIESCRDKAIAELGEEDVLYFEYILPDLDWDKVFTEDRQYSENAVDAIETYQKLKDGFKYAKDDYIEEYCLYVARLVAQGKGDEQMHFYEFVKQFQ